MGKDIMDLIDEFIEIILKLIMRYGVIFFLLIIMIMDKEYVYDVFEVIKKV